MSFSTFYVVEEVSMPPCSAIYHELLLYNLFIVSRNRKIQSVLSEQLMESKKPELPPQVTFIQRMCCT